MNTPHTDSQLIVAATPPEPAPTPPEAVAAASQMCRCGLLDSVLSSVMWIVFAVVITKLIDWYGWSRWWLVAVAICCLAAAWQLVDLGYAVAAAWRERRIRRSVVKPPAGGDR